MGLIDLVNSAEMKKNMGIFILISVTYKAINHTTTKQIAIKCRLPCTQWGGSL